MHADAINKQVNKKHSVQSLRTCDFALVGNLALIFSSQKLQLTEGAAQKKAVCSALSMPTSPIVSIIVSICE